MRRVLAVLVAVAAYAGCGGGSSSDGASAPGGDGSGPGGTETGNDGGPAPPVPTGGSSCTPPAALADVSAPTTVVGNGDPASCTEAALRDAVTKGGVVTFSCGAAPATITLAADLVVSNDQDLVVDGGGTVTLSGNGATRIFTRNSTYDKTAPTLTVQRITLAHGKSTDVANTKDTTKGGGAIYSLGGNVTVIDATFDDNHGPDDGQDVSGGAIFVSGAGGLIVVGSTFQGNTASNGGAIGILGASLAIATSTFGSNSAIGSGGNPGNGGNGGSIVMDGQGRTLDLCGIAVSGSQATAFGGALFRTSYANEPTTIDRSTFDSNMVTDTTESQAGAIYLQGTKIAITNTSITNNKANFAAAMSIYEHGGPAPGELDMSNVTIAGNTVTTRSDFTKEGLVGGVTIGDRVTGAWQNVTIALNAAQFAVGIGGDSSRLTITNSIISNTAANLYTPLNCNGTSAGGSGNLQWPAQNKGNDDIDCVTGIQHGDPLLGALVAADGVLVTTPGAGSPAIGIGQNCPATDQLGHARAAVGCTAGAIEVAK